MSLTDIELTMSLINIELTMSLTDIELNNEFEQQTWTILDQKRNS